MDRIKDSPELFGCGAGRSTTGEIVCEWCGNTYEDKLDITSICWTEFAGKEICECCFGKIEAEIIRRIDDILPWYKKYLMEKTAKMVNIAERNLADIDDIERMKGRQNEEKNIQA